MNKCKVCNGEILEVVYEVNDLPIFQNKVYSSKQEATQSKRSNIKIVQCQECGFIFNALFDPLLMDYEVV